MTVRELILALSSLDPKYTDTRVEVVVQEGCLGISYIEVTDHVVYLEVEQE